MYSAEKITLKEMRLAELEYESFKEYRKRVNHIGKLAILDIYYWKYFVVCFLLSGLIPFLGPIFVITIPFALGLRFYNNHVLKKSFKHERRMICKL
ncbi:hypothetical protein GNF82_13650 [Clostridium perfringens]